MQCLCINMMMYTLRTYIGYSLEKIYLDLWIKIDKELNRRFTRDFSLKKKNCNPEASKL